MLGLEKNQTSLYDAILSIVMALLAVEAVSEMQAPQMLTRVKTAFKDK
jgi:hypothetical protein